MQCSHLGYILQLILKHIISSSAVHPAAVWTTSNNSKWSLPPPPPPRKSGRQIHVSPRECFTSRRNLQQCGPLCTQASPAHLAGGRTGSAPELAPLSRYFSAPNIIEMLCTLSSLHLPRSHYHCASVIIIVLTTARHWRSGQQDSPRGPSPFGEVIYPDPSCHSSPGFTAPRVFSRGLPPSLPPR